MTTVTADANGQLPAEWYLGNANPGRYFVVADYIGDGLFHNQLDAASVVTVQANSQTALTANPNPSTVGQNVTLTATVSSTVAGLGNPTGTVDFYDRQPGHHDHRDRRGYYDVVQCYRPTIARNAAVDGGRHCVHL
jgi:hypothetical protein